MGGCDPNQLLCGIILQVSDPNSLRLGLFDVGIDLKGKNVGFWPIGLLETE